MDCSMLTTCVDGKENSHPWVVAMYDIQTLTVMYHIGVLLGWNTRRDCWDSIPLCFRGFDTQQANSLLVTQLEHSKYEIDFVVLV